MGVKTSNALEVRGSADRWVVFHRSSFMHVAWPLGHPPRTRTFPTWL
jgi:hypothetical protein